MWCSKNENLSVKEVQFTQVLFLNTSISFFLILPLHYIYTMHLVTVQIQIIHWLVC